MRAAALEVFREACGESAPALSGAQLEELARRGADAWPQVEVELELFARCLGTAVASGATLAKMRADEVWLAAGCAAGDEAAQRIFDEHYLGDLPRLLGKLRLDDDAIADAGQATREKLLTAKEGLPRIVAYAGRGQLGALVRVVATRAGIDIQRARGQQREVAADDLTAVLIASADPERAAVLAAKHEAFRRAFEVAVGQLSASDRMVLRLYAVEGVGIDGIATACGIHRSTAARRLARIRSALADATRVHLGEVGLRERELESVIAVVEEGLDLTLSRILAEPSSRGSGDQTVAVD